MELSTYTLRVNGVDHVVTAEPRETLADVLRDRLGLTGTHIGCEHGICGACTISLDGDPARACITYAIQAEGCEILTIEGVQDEPAVRALSEAFSRNHGLQCGFCTPGMVMLGRWTLSLQPNPTPEGIDDIVSSNICRCGCYQAIRTSYREASVELRTAQSPA